MINMMYENTEVHSILSVYVWIPLKRILPLDPHWILKRKPAMDRNVFMPIPFPHVWRRKVKFFVTSIWCINQHFGVVAAPFAGHSVGPGPAGYDISNKRCVDLPCPPAYSIARRDEYQFKQCSPGPSAYGIKDNFVKPMAPAYSL